MPKHVTAAVLSLLASSAARSIDVVLAHHDEDLGWLETEPALSKLEARVVVYHKGTGDLPKLPVGFEVAKLTNVGRESHTYLHHIVTHYDTLADWTVFSQAGQPTFGYRGHRDGGGHLVAGHSFAQYLQPSDSSVQSMFTYTA